MSEEKITINSFKEFLQSWSNARGIIVLWGLFFLYLAVTAFMNANPLTGILFAFLGSGTTGAGFAFQGIALSDPAEGKPHMSRYNAWWPLLGKEGVDMTTTRHARGFFRLPTTWREWIGAGGLVMACSSVILVSVTGYAIITAGIGGLLWGLMNGIQRVYETAEFRGQNPLPTHWPITPLEDKLIYDKESKTYKLASDSQVTATLS